MEPEVVVPMLESSSNSSDDPYFRNSIGVVLGRIKHPLAEAALIRLLKKEKDPMPRAFLATALCDLCTTDGLELLHDAVVEKSYDRSVADLMELLVTQCKFVGYAPPELPQWNKELAKKAAEFGARRKLLNRVGADNSAKSMLETISLLLAQGGDKHENATPPPLPDSLSDSSETTMPIRRSEPKVGRNEPCPCGSGKKHKKCCGKG